MPLNVVASHADIVAAINGFNPRYHHNYALVRALSAAYLAAPTPANIAALAPPLIDVLRQWGADSRKAPLVQSVPTVQETLALPILHASLARLAANPIPTLGIVGGVRQVAGGPVAHPGFDNELITTILHLSAGIFVGCTNATYPMKALLLLTGFMPAFDSQVRGGLHRGGFVGMSATRFLTPAGPADTNAHKVTRIPFYLSECYAAYAPLLAGAATASHFPALAADPGRLFDVLLFMQNDPASPLLLQLVPPNPHWRNLP